MGNGRIPLRDGCVVDLRRRVVEVDGRDLPLTDREAELLAYLAARIGEDVSFDALARDVWHHAPNVRSRAPFHAIQRLKHKIERDPSAPRHLIAVYGTGYRLVTDAYVEPPQVFFGRDRELADLADLLRHHRLVTVTGIGGIGKTTLVRASRCAGAWIQLTRAATEAEILHAATQALGLSPQPSRTAAVAQIGVALAGRGPAIVVLDEAEGAAGALGPLVAAWLDRAPETRFLVTSRIPLGVYGEAVLPLAPLATPAVDADDATIHASPAIRLWETRARAANHRPSLSAAQLAALVTVLGGHPLAIEVLAGHPDPVAHLAATDRPIVVETAIAWAWGSLSPAARAAVAQCTVFRAPFDADDAEAVLVLPDGAWVVDAIDEAASRSLLTRTGPRFQLPEPVRAYAADHLDDRAAPEQRHGAWFARFADDFDGAPVHALDDARAASERAVARGDRAVAVATAVAAARRLTTTGPFELAVTLLEPFVGDDRVDVELGELLLLTGQRDRARAMLDAVVHRATDAAILARAWAKLGRVEQVAGHTEEARQAVDRAAAIAATTSDRRLEGEVLTTSAVVALLCGRNAEAAATGFRAQRTIPPRLAPRLFTAIGLALQVTERAEGQAMLERALDAARAVGDHSAEGTTLGHLGQSKLAEGRLDEAEALLAQALDIHREVGNLLPMANGLLTRAQIRWRRCASDGRAEVDEALTLMREVGDHIGEANALLTLGALELHLGRYDAAREVFTLAIARTDAVGRPLGSAHARVGLARALGNLGRTTEAVQAAHDAIARYREVEAVRSEAWALAVLSEVHRCGGATDDAERCAQHAVAIAARLDDPWVRATASEALGNLVFALGRAAEARAHLREVERLLREGAEDLSAAVVSVRLAELDRRDGRTNEAHARLDRAERDLRAVGGGMELARALCTRARLHLDRGDLAAAVAAQREASSIPLTPGTDVAALVDAVGAEVALRHPETDGHRSVR